MSRSVSEHVRATVAAAVAKRSLLRVSEEAMRIAKKSGAPLETVSRELVEAGIQARINMEFGAPPEYQNGVARPRAAHS